MVRVKWLLSVAVAVALSMIAVFASTAAAKVAFEWKVNGKPLAAGEQRTFTSSAESTFDLKINVGGAAALLASNKLKVEPGALIKGGKPGTLSETVVFSNVTVAKPANCEVESLPNPVVGTVRTVPIRSEIVEGKTSNEPLVLFFFPDGDDIHYATVLRHELCNQKCGGEHHGFAPC